MAIYSHHEGQCSVNCTYVFIVVYIVNSREIVRLTVCSDTSPIVQLKRWAGLVFQFLITHWYFCWTSIIFVLFETSKKQFPSFQKYLTSLLICTYANPSLKIPQPKFLVILTFFVLIPAFSFSVQSQHIKPCLPTQLSTIKV